MGATSPCCGCTWRIWIPSWSQGRSVPQDRLDQRDPRGYRWVARVHELLMPWGLITKESLDLSMHFNKNVFIMYPILNHEFTYIWKYHFNKVGVKKKIVCEPHHKATRDFFSIFKQILKFLWKLGPLILKNLWFLRYFKLQNDVLKSDLHWHFLVWYIFWFWNMIFNITTYQFTNAWGSSNHMKLCYSEV